MSVLTTWLGAYKYILILGLALMASAGWNLHQWKHAGVIKERARADAYADALKITAGIARDKTKDDAKLLTIVQSIADQRVKRETIYRQAAPTPMAANCAPGRERMDAVNNGIPPKAGATP